MTYHKRDIVHSSNVLWASSGCILMSWRRTGSFIVEFVRNVDSFKSAISSLSYIIPEHNYQSLCYLTLIEGTADSSNRKMSAIWLHGLTCCVGKGFRFNTENTQLSISRSNAACQPGNRNGAIFTIRRFRSASINYWTAKRLRIMVGNYAGSTRYRGFDGIDISDENDDERSVSSPAHQ